MFRSHYANEINLKLDGKKVRIAGWVRVIREHGGLKFVVIADRTGTAQVTAKKDDISEELFKKISSLGREYVVSIYGIVKKNDKAPNGVEIIPEKLDVLNVSEATLPLDFKIKASLDTRLDARAIDVRKPEVQAIFKVRDKMIEGGRQFLRKKGCLEFTSPKIISAASEGGTNLFPISYFDREAFLCQSPQLYKQMMMATGFDRVYEVATYFRAEEHDTVWHMNEVNAFDLEMSFIEDEEDVMKMLEGLVLAALKTVRDECKEELKLLNAKVNVPKEVTRVTYDEALEILKKEKINIEWGEDLTTEAEKKLGEVMAKKGIELFFIKKYPLQIKPFYAMPDSSNPKLSNSFDLEYRSREISSGGQRIHLHPLLVQRIKAKGLNPEDFKGYLDAFRFGMPPHGGFGLGIERLLMQILGLQNIRETILFPRDRKRLTP